VCFFHSPTTPLLERTCLRELLNRRSNLPPPGPVQGSIRGILALSVFTVSTVHNRDSIPYSIFPISLILYRYLTLTRVRVVPPIHSLTFVVKLSRFHNESFNYVGPTEEG
jgi:hypothetical protein